MKFIWLTQEISKRHRIYFENLILKNKKVGLMRTKTYTYTYEIKRLSYCGYFCKLEGIKLNPPTIKCFNAEVMVKDNRHE